MLRYTKTFAGPYRSHHMVAIDTFHLFNRTPKVHMFTITGKLRRGYGTML